MKRRAGWVVGVLLLVGLGMGLAALRPAARQPPRPPTARVILITRSPTPGLPPSPSSSPTPTAAARRMVVTGTGGVGLRLREGPGLQHATIAMLAEGTILWAFPEAVEADGLRWRRVRTEEALEGWVAEAYLAPAEPEADRTPAPPAGR